MSKSTNERAVEFTQQTWKECAVTLKEILGIENLNTKPPEVITTFCQTLVQMVDDIDTFEYNIHAYDEQTEKLVKLRKKLEDLEAKASGSSPGCDHPPSN